MQQLHDDQIEKAYSPFSNQKHRLDVSTDVLIVNIKQTAMEKKGKQSEESSALFMHQLVTLADLDHCDTRAPFNIGDECRMKLGIVGQANLVGGFEQQGYPALSMLLGEVQRIL